MTEALHYEEWMSSGDALMWHIERDPLLRSTVTAIWVLDRVPDRDLFFAAVGRAVEVVPRLRQRAASDRYGIAPPRWESDPNFDMSYHVRRERLGGDGSLRELLDHAAPIAVQAFDKDRPLWEYHLVDGVAKDRSALIMKVHHAISDGMGMVRMMLSLVDFERDPKRDGETDEDSALYQGASRSDLLHLQDALLFRANSAATRAARWMRAYGQNVGQFVAHPFETSSKWSATAASIGRLLKPATEPLSPLMNERSLNARLDVLKYPLDDLKKAAKVVQGTLNDAFVGGVTGGLRLYHEHFGMPVDDLRMNMPINIREGESSNSSSNQFVPARFLVPISIEDPVDRMLTLHELVQEQRAEPALPLIDEVQAVIGGLGPRLATTVAGSMLKALDFVTSNVPGPPVPLYIAGARIEETYPFGPLAGAATNVTLFSYNKTVHIGFNTDRAAVEEPELFMECMRKGFDEIIAVGRRSE